MSDLVVAPVVEGHGEQASAIRTLLTRIWIELLGGTYLDVLQPIRRPKSKLVQQNELLRAIDLAALKLAQSTDRRGLILVVLDADTDAPCVLGPRLQAIAMHERPHLDVAVVIANVEYETWFVAAAPSLTHYFDLSLGNISSDPETARQGKGTVERLMGDRYGETIDQPRLSAAIDLAMCRDRSRSFDKLCRELEKRRS